MENDLVCNALTLSRKIDACELLNDLFLMQSSLESAKARDAIRLLHVEIADHLIELRNQYRQELAELVTPKK